jgi:hypothetical protein
MWLIWVRGFRGWEPQKCAELQTNGAGVPISVTYRHALTAEQFKLPLRELEKIFPPPPEPEQESV